MLRVSVAHSDEVLDRTGVANSDPSDRELARRAADGDESAWETLLARHSDLLRRHAIRLARATEGRSREDRLDEESDLYLFLAERARVSLNSFAGRCKMQTWIGAVVGNRAHMLKSWLRRKDPARAEVRIPVVLRERPVVDHEIFRRLVWGLDPRRTALELGVPEGRCRDVEALIDRHSPRIAVRIRANRMSRGAPLRLVSGDDEDPHAIELAEPRRNPYQQLVHGEQEAVVDAELDAGLQELGRAERRLLYLLYDQGMTVSDVVRLAASDGAGMAGLEDANHCYYLKDRALQSLTDRIVQRLRDAGYRTAPVGRRQLLRCVEDVLRSRGVPMTTPNDDNLSL